MASLVLRNSPWDFTLNTPSVFVANIEVFKIARQRFVAMARYLRGVDPVLA